MNNIQNIVVNLPKSLNQIYKVINKNKLGIVFVVDNKQTLVGSISDGDIRRYLLRSQKKKITYSSKLINKNVRYLNVNTKISKIIEKLSSNKGILKCIPLVDKNKKIVDYSTFNNIRSFPLALPSIGKEEIQNVNQCLNSGWISSNGQYVKKFEDLFLKTLKCKKKYATSTSSGTTALELAIKSLGIGKGDEVILPNLTFGASINSIINCGAKPIIIDIEPKTWTIDTKKIKKNLTKKTKAILAVHLYGQPCNISELKKISNEKKIFLIEDSAESLGAKYKKKYLSIQGDAACFSFFGNKNITTGEGGMVLYKSEKFFKKALIIKNHGMPVSGDYVHSLPGSNYRMTNLQAAIGCGQLKRFKMFMQIRENVFTIYNNYLKKFNDLTFLPKNTWSKNSFWLYTIKINNFSKKERNKLVNKLKLKGIDARPVFIPLNDLMPYKRYASIKDNFSISKKISYSSISLPTHDLKKDDIEYICKEFISEIIKINTNFK